MTETPARRWPKTGNVGASTQLRTDEQPVTVPARPYPGEPNSQPGSNLEQLGDRVPVAPVADVIAFPLGSGILGWESGVPRTPPYPCGIKPVFGPPDADELRAIVADLNAHGGFDETFVAALLEQAAEPPHLIGDRNPVTTEPGPDVTQHRLDTIHEWLGKLPPPPKPVKLTPDQLATVQRNTPPPEPFAPDRSLWAVPVEIVETVEESTPYQLANAQPDGIIEIRGDLSTAEFETLRADWLRAVDAKPRLSRWLVEADREFVDHVNDGVDRAAVLDAVRAAGGVIGPLPVPAELRSRPWWRRALDRIRRRPR
jgi:hypothetical protein